MSIIILIITRHLLTQMHCAKGSRGNHSFFQLYFSAKTCDHCNFMATNICSLNYIFPIIVYMTKLFGSFAYSNPKVELQSSQTQASDHEYKYNSLIGKEIKAHKTQKWTKCCSMIKQLVGWL